MSTRDETGRFTDPVERRMMHQRGFGDGAKSSAQKFPADPDYMAAWRRGLDAARTYMSAVCAWNDFPPPNILREGGEP